MGRFDQRAVQPSRGAKEILQWKVVDALAGRNRKDPGGFATPRKDPDLELIQSGTAQLTWIGHASFLLTLGGKRILIDPVFAPRVGHVARFTPPGIPLEALPPIDLVLVTHNHRDHLDGWTLQRLGSGPSYIVPLGNGPLVKKFGASRVTELDWWESTSFGSLAITLVPARHWSMTTPWDANDMLWGGYVIRGPEGAAYHSGDTGFSDEFAKIGANAGPIDWAMLPIGAYDPRWFMQPQHMNPEDAVEAAKALRARIMVAMHWGTFKLTDEPMSEPPERARKAHRDSGGVDEALWILDVGETRRLSSP